MNIAEEARKEMAWHIKINRLIDTALIKEAERNTPHAAEILKANRADKKAEALKKIEEAKKYIADWIADKLETKNITEEEAAEARQAVADMAEELKKKAEALPA